MHYKRGIIWYFCILTYKTKLNDTVQQWLRDMSSGHVMRVSPSISATDMSEVLPTIHVLTDHPHVRALNYTSLPANPYNPGGLKKHLKSVYSNL